MIKINNLNKYYNKGKNNEIHVINDISLELPDVGFVSILGQSGSGKTTLLNVIGGLDSATGSIIYDDNKFDHYQMSKIDEYRAKNIGYIFQNYNLVDDMTIFDNLKIVLEAIGVTDLDEIKKRCDYVLRAVGLYKFRKKLANELSGGQLQRVSIARALVKNSKIIIADEPTGNLDSNNSIEIMNILKKISEKSLVILVTHNQNLASVYSDIILDIVDGKIVNVRKNTGESSLINNDSNNIYLKDYKQKIIDGDIKTTIYSNEDISNVEFKIVYKNGTYYLDSNVKIELIENTNLKLVNEHYEEQKIDNIKEELDYDTSWFIDKTDEKTKKTRFKDQLAQAFKSFRSVRPRSKFLRVVLVIIGAILGFLSIGLSINLVVDTGSLLNRKDLYTLEAEQKSVADVNQAIESAYLNGVIDDYYSANVSGISPSTITVSKKINSYSITIKSLTYNAIYGFDFIKDKKFIVGMMPQENSDVVIDKKFADRIVKENGLTSYEELLYTTLSISSYSSICKISGVVEGNENLLYLNPKQYSLASIYKFDNGEFANVTIKSIELFNLALLSGKMPEKYNEIIISKNLKASNKEFVVGDKIELSGFTYVISGIFESLDNVSYVNNENIIKRGFDPTYSYNKLLFKTSNVKATKDYFKDLGYNMDTPYNFYTSQAIKMNFVKSISLIVASTILLGIVIIYIYFTMRAQMISDIKTIGTLRSIGIKKSSIIGKYLLETIITTIFTSFIGYTIVMILTGLLVKHLYSILGSNINVFTTIYPYLGFVILLVFNTFFGILPIMNLLRKTPSEIMAKYDM